MKIYRTKFDFIIFSLKVSYFGKHNQMMRRRAYTPGCFYAKKYVIFYSNLPILAASPVFIGLWDREVRAFRPPY